MYVLLCRGGHPYLTGLSIVGGIYYFGLEGAVLGPVLLCCLLLAPHLYSLLIRAAATSNTDTPANTQGTSHSHERCT